MNFISNQFNYKLTLHQAHSLIQLIKIQLCKAKVSEMTVGYRRPATSKMEFFVAIIKEWKLLNIVPRAPSQMLEQIQKRRKHKCHIMTCGSFHK